MRLLEIERVKSVLRRKERYLESVIKTPCPVVESEELQQGHKRRQRNAEIFITEISELLMFATISEIELVDKATFNKEVESADFHSIELDGQFCMLALISNAHREDEWLAWVAPIDSI